MSSTDFVAISRVQHDGETVAYPGDSVDHLDRDTLTHLYLNGALAVKGSKNDPNTWVDTREEWPTTPRVVEDSLRLQEAHQLFGHEDNDVLTQPHLPAPENPGALADGTHVATTKQAKADAKANEAAE